FQHGAKRKQKLNVMKKEYDLSKGVRGKFYCANAEFDLPIYLEPGIAEFVQNWRARKRLKQDESLIFF
ncbi:MAG: hypothetical protein M3R14_05060, partial [Acidobacteriota bacterium]|nr:hypothetical protein [Acidobacteriota bacterium]